MGSARLPTSPSFLPASIVTHLPPTFRPPPGTPAPQVACKSRLNTLRDNRLLDPSFWQGPTGAAKDIVCADPVVV